MQTNPRYMLFRVEAKNTAAFLELVSEVVQCLEIENPRIVQTRIGVTALAPLPGRSMNFRDVEPEYESIFIHNTGGGGGMTKDVFLAWCAFSVDPFGEVTLTRHSNALPTLGPEDRVIKTAADFRALMIEGWRSKAWRERHLNPLLPTWGMEHLEEEPNDLTQQDLFCRGRIYLTDNPDHLKPIVSDAPVSIFSHPLFTSWMEAEDTPVPLDQVKAGELISQIITSERCRNSAVAWYIPYWDNGLERLVELDGRPCNLDNLLSKAYSQWPQVIVVSQGQVQIANSDGPIPPLLTNTFKINKPGAALSPLLTRQPFTIRLVQHDDRRVMSGIVLSLSEVFRRFSNKLLYKPANAEGFESVELAAVVKFFKTIGLRARLIVPVDFQIDAEGRVQYHGSFCEWVADNLGRTRCESFDYQLPDAVLVGGEDHQVVPSAQLACAIDAELAIIEQAKNKASEE